MICIFQPLCAPGLLNWDVFNGNSLYLLSYTIRLTVQRGRLSGLGWFPVGTFHSPEFRTGNDFFTGRYEK